MDTITHLVLGACAGEAIAGKQLGKKALAIGAFVNIIPDLDVISQLWLDTDSGLLAHRGFTHSFAFSVVAAFAFAYLLRNNKKKLSFGFWFIFFFAELFIHIFIDAFNAYGTGWFEPFSHYRVSFNTIFVVDPFFSLWPGIAFIILIFLKSNSEKRRVWVRFGLGISALYFSYCIVNKVKTQVDINEMLSRQQINYQASFTTPAPLNNWLWYIVAGNDSGFYTGYYSVFDSRKHIDLHYFARKEYLLQPIKNRQSVENLVRFSKGFYTIEQWGDTLVFNDLRFGQMIGWYNPNEKFAFHYYLQSVDKENKLVVQRGRFAKWNMPVIRSLITRTIGN